MKKIILVLGAIMVLFLISTKEEVYVIPSDAIRFRIIANSNSIKDQHIKQQVKLALEKEIVKTTVNAKNKEEAKLKITKNLDNYQTIVKKVLKDNNENIKFDINYGDNYFPEKIYKGIKYEKGNYESLVITLGKGAGNNWWCILFPPICSLDESTSSEVEYKFFIKEIVKKYILDK